MLEGRGFSGNGLAGVKEAVWERSAGQRPSPGTAGLGEPASQSRDGAAAARIRGQLVDRLIDAVQPERKSRAPWPRQRALELRVGLQLGLPEDLCLRDQVRAAP